MAVTQPPAVYQRNRHELESREELMPVFQAAKRDLSKRYPPGRFIAFDDGQIVADAASFDALTETLTAIGKNRPDVFVVQAGVDYPDEVIILL